MEKLHKTDERNLCQILKSEDVPTDIQEEYGKRKWMLSRLGIHGPLGSVSLVELLRFLGYESPPMERQSIGGNIDWTTIAPDTEVAVDLGIKTGIRRGLFTGKRSSGGWDVFFPDMKPSLRIAPSSSISLDLTKAGKRSEVDRDKPVAWDIIESNTPVTVKWNNEVLEGEFQELTEEGKAKVMVAPKGNRSGFEMEYPIERLELV